MDGNIQKYMAFVKVIEYGSFSRTAEMMAYSQSGISRMIKDLEEDWQITLLERSKGGVSLTSEGMSVLPYVRKIVDDVERMEQHIDEIKGLETGLIRIGSIASAAAHLLPEMMKDFRQEHPMIEFEIKVGGYEDIAGWIREGSVDCGFLSSETAVGFDAVEIIKDEYFVVLPKGHPLANKKNLSKADLEEDDFIMIEKEGTREIADMLKENGVKVNTRYTTIDDYAAMSMVENGLGISIMNGLILKRCPYDVVIKKMPGKAYRSIVLATKKKVEQSNAVRKFIYL